MTTKPGKDLRMNGSEGAVRQSASIDLVQGACIPFFGRRPSNVAGVRHISFPLLHISMPILILLFSPELLVCLALMLKISPLAAPREDALYVVDALHIWRQVCGKQRG